MDCFVLYEARRFDIHGKAELARLEKYYLVDLGLRRTVLGNKAMDVGHTLENVVYLELLRRGFEVYVGRVDQTEVDFVAKSADGYQYIQVSATVRDPDTLALEFRRVLFRSNSCSPSTTTRTWITTASGSAMRWNGC